LKEKLDQAEKACEAKPVAVTFRELAEKWREHILPHHKASVRMYRQDALETHLMPSLEID
jgi:hypothetical protein